MSIAAPTVSERPARTAALIFAATPLQICVQLVQVTGFRKRHPVVASKVSAFAFDAALFVAAGRVAELALKAPVRSEGDETARLLTAISAQDLLHCTLQVVIAEHAKDAAEVAKCQLMSLEKCLLGGMSIGPVIGRTAGHRAHLEDLQLDAFATQNGPGFIPIHLRFRAPRVRLRHEYFAALQPQLLPPPSHVAANRALAPAEARQLSPADDAKMRRAVCRCFGGAARSARKIRSMKSDAASSLRSRRCWGLLAAGSALRNASRTIRR